ncbi:hypothetical protein DFP72DRAFT_885107 [Ephemerocybe angulata]|uniref:Protein kinase domain-containing protein n=1 Tax=Ephemerocybe angulata TaxID=980116 RepID=A0A8H6M8Z8_9AGAR|nr:hypothetical protein DFP72DRAFT_885107 [Tulosesus angulatus]
MDLSGYEPPIVPIGTNYLYELPNQGEDGSQSRFFLTTRSLRGTRVWEAIEVRSRKRPQRIRGAKPVILKDVRIDSSRLTEKAIQKQLFGDIRAFASNPDWRKHPLLSKFDEADKDKLVDLFENDKFEDLFLRISMEHITPATKSNNVEGKDEASVTELSKIRVVTVFEEVCTALDDLQTLGEVMDIMKQTLLPLQLMMLAGWVHRDISSGNILAFREHSNAPWTVKLADLEYAKKWSPEAKQEDSKTGTAFFMPWEIQNRRRERKSCRDPWIILIHDFQHDLESIWWIWLWIITCRVAGWQYSRELVAGIFVDVARPGDLRREEAFGMGIPGLDVYIHEALKSFPPIIDRVRDRLVDLMIMHVQRPAEANFERFSEGHMLLKQGLEDLNATKSTWEDVKLDGYKNHPGELAERGLPKQISKAKREKGKIITRPPLEDSQATRASQNPLKRIREESDRTTKARADPNSTTRATRSKTASTLKDSLRNDVKRRVTGASVEAFRGAVPKDSTASKVGGTVRKRRRGS